MDLDRLIQIGVDAAAAFIAVNIVNALRQGWLWPAVRKWLNAPRHKRDRQTRVIGLAFGVSAAVACGFALRASGSLLAWHVFVGEWISRVLISWVLALGQFDVIRLVWPKMFDPKKEDETLESLDRAP